MSDHTELVERLDKECSEWNSLRGISVQESLAIGVLLRRAHDAITALQAEVESLSTLWVTQERDELKARINIHNWSSPIKDEIKTNPPPEAP